MAAPQDISVALLRPLAELLSRLDVDGTAPPCDATEFLVGLGVDDATAPETYVDGALVDRALGAIAARRGDAAFSLTLARLSLVRPLGLFGHLVWLSGTVRDALTRAVKFYAMITRRTTLTLVEHGAIATLRGHAVGPASRGAILTELAFASVALRARAATDDRFTLRAVRFAHAHPNPPAEYREVFGAPVTFGAAADELELDRAHLDLRLATADPITSAALEAKVAAMTAAPASRSPFLDRVRRAAAVDLATAPTLATLGRALGISARTLRRHLEQAGTTLRVLVDDVRRARADELLATGTSVKEIAFALGFSEPSAFSRAYKRWTGRAPKLGPGGQSGH